jgi:hypothetical protein
LGAVLQELVVVMVEGVVQGRGLDEAGFEAGDELFLAAHMDLVPEVEAGGLGSAAASMSANAFVAALPDGRRYGARVGCRAGRP